MEDKSTLRVNGYQFLTEEEAEKARVDARKIDYLKTHTASLQDANSLAAVYQKAIDSKIFSTIVGWSYLYELRQRMLDAGTPEEAIVPIPVRLQQNPALQPSPQPSTVQVPVEIKKREIVPLHLVSYIANALLVILVIVMFIVAYLGETNNVLNYKRNIINQYAAWEDELKEREEAIREKEASLQIGQ